MNGQVKITNVAGCIKIEEVGGANFEFQAINFQSARSSFKACSKDLDDDIISITKVKINPPQIVSQFLSDWVVIWNWYTHTS